METRRIACRILGLVGVVVLFAPCVRAVDYYVNAVSGSDFNNGLSALTAWETLAHATITAQSGDVIHVLPGEYDHSANNEVFPIEVSKPLTIIADGTSPGVDVRVGGDAVSGSSASAVFEIDNASGVVVLDGLVIVGESTTSDGPHAVRVTKPSASEGSVKIRSCAIERNAMPVSGASGRASILIEGGASANFSVEIDDCIIAPSDRGGVEVRPSSSDTLTVKPFAVRGTRIIPDVGTTASFGIQLSDDAGGYLSAGGQATEGILDNVIGSVAGIGTGIRIDLTRHDTTASSVYNVGRIARNRITNCSQDGVYLETSGSSSSETNITVAGFTQNIISDCQGDGLAMVFNGSGDGYFNLSPLEANVLVDNGGYGASITNLGMDAMSGITSANNTIVYNGDGAWGITTFGSSPPPSLVASFFQTIANEIWYGNNGGGDQVVVDAGQLSSFAALSDHSCWQNFPLTLPYQGNIDTDPQFASVSTGDYHLAAGSPCIDTGGSLLATSIGLDFEGDGRPQDGDYACTGTLQRIVDMGADEVPTPDCP